MQWNFSLKSFHANNTLHLQWIAQIVASLWMYETMFESDPYNLAYTPDVTEQMEISTTGNKELIKNISR